MKKIISLLAIVLLLASCGVSESPANNDAVVVCTESLTDIWLLAGGSVAATTGDSFDAGLPLADNTVNLGNVKSPDMERILALKPAVVILNQTVPGQVELGEALTAAGVTCELYEYETFSNYLQLLRKFTEKTERKDLFELYGTYVQQRVNQAIAHSEGKGGNEVLLLRAQSSGVSVKNSDSVTGAILKDLGCVNIADDERGLLEQLSAEAIIKHDPEYIFITLMGDEAAALRSWEALLDNPAWSELSAVRFGKTYVLPKELFHQKPNERWGESYEQIADILGY